MSLMVTETRVGRKWIVKQVLSELKKVGKSERGEYNLMKARVEVTHLENAADEREKEDCSSYSSLNDRVRSSAIVRARTFTERTSIEHSSPSPNTHNAHCTRSNICIRDRNEQMILSIRILWNRCVQTQLYSSRLVNVRITTARDLLRSFRPERSQNELQSNIQVLHQTRTMHPIKHFYPR